MLHCSSALRNLQFLERKRAKMGDKGYIELMKLRCLTHMEASGTQTQCLPICRGDCPDLKRRNAELMSPGDRGPDMKSDPDGHLDSHGMESDRDLTGRATSWYEVIGSSIHGESGI